MKTANKLSLMSQILSAFTYFEDRTKELVSEVLDQLSRETLNLLTPEKGVCLIEWGEEKAGLTIPIYLGLTQFHFKFDFVVVLRVADLTEDEARRKIAHELAHVYLYSVDKTYARKSDSERDKLAESQVDEWAIT